MAKRQVNIGEAKAQLSDLVNRALAGESVIIAKDNKPLVKLVPLRSSRAAKRRPGFGKGTGTMSSDFDAPLEDFAEYQ